MVGPGYPCFIIAEAGVNHNGDLGLAKQLVDKAIKAEADAVKFQTFRADRLLTPDVPKAEYQKQTTGAAEGQFEMIRRLELSPEMHLEIMKYCQGQGILFMSSVFDEAGADLLSDLDVAVFKVPSGEITNLPLLAHVARKGKPLIVSTGMAYLGEVEAAVRTMEEVGNEKFSLLHCVSNYPADPKDVNLMAMRTMSAAFGVPVGYSDHTMGIEVPLAAVALGASVIEKHLTLSRGLPGPDHRASLEPDEFVAMVRGIRKVESAMGGGRKQPAISEAEPAAVARKGLVAARDIPAGTTLTEDLVAVKRAGSGLGPALRPYLIGHTVRRAIPANAVIALEMLE
jgi:N-acetylneuraminate synthase